MNKIVLITGTRKGIGRYLAEKFLERGDHVIGCSRKESDLRHDKYYHSVMNISSEAEIKYMLKGIGRIDILINNAGVASMNHVLLTSKLKAIEIFETNFMGTFLMSREVGKIMLRQGKGDIINFSSVAVKLNVQGEAVYTASKAAIESFTKTMAKELPKEIKVNCIAPGVVDTDLSRHRKIDLPLTTFKEILDSIDFIINNDITGRVI
jgi:3-oxoacyl-[acyl-carrier protein] reductase